MPTIEVETRRTKRPAKHTSPISIEDVISHYVVTVVSYREIVSFVTKEAFQRHPVGNGTQVEIRETDLVVVRLNLAAKRESRCGQATTEVVKGEEWYRCRVGG